MEVGGVDEAASVPLGRVQAAPEEVVADLRAQAMEKERAFDIGQRSQRFGRGPSSRSK